METRSQKKKGTSRSKEHSNPPRSVSKSKEKPKFQPQPNTIYFYGKNSANGFMSNFYPSVIQIDSQQFATVQHYFQSRKFVGTPKEIKVIQAKTPGQAFNLAREFKKNRVQNWDEIKDGVMKKGLIAKFTQHEDLKKMLLETIPNDLVEHTWKDKYWADGGGPGRGINMLGKLLVEVRNEVQKK